MYRYILFCFYLKYFELYELILSKFSILYPQIPSEYQRFSDPLWSHRKRTLVEMS